MSNLKLYSISLFLTVLTSLLSSCGDDETTDTPCDSCTTFEKTTDPAGNVAVRVHDYGQGIGTRTLYNDTVYILDNFVFVNNGQTLSIEAGTVIKGESGTGTNASAMIVARGGKIMAEGAAGAPIIFTSLIDNVADTLDLQPNARGLWGGLILLGKATINDPSGESAIEGIPTSETRGLYGGTDDSDNSGTLKYISIRHGGSEIGDGNEINGLTLGAVGSGTTIDHVEVFANFDDGFEFFGGAVSCKHLIAVSCGDDAFDWDQGFHGKIQYLLAIQSNDAAGHCFEGNGVPNDAAYDYNATPQAKPYIANGTFVGNYNLDGGDDQLARIRQGSGGYFYNNIFYNFGQGLKVDAISAGEPIESQTRLEQGTLVFKHNLFSKIKDKNTGVDCTDLSGVANESGSIAALVAQHLGDNANEYASDPGLTDISISAGTGGFNPLLVSGGSSAGLPPYNDPAIESVSYIGAFGNSNWASGWTALSVYKY